MFKFGQKMPFFMAMIAFILSFKVFASDSIGLIIDNVSADLSCQNNSCQSQGLSILKTAINQAKATSKIKDKTFYLLADFASFNGINAYSKAKLSEDSLCTNNNPQNYLLNFKSLPLIKPSVVPGVSQYIGRCIDGETVIASYKTIAQSLGFKAIKMIPLFSGSNSQFIEDGKTQLTPEQKNNLLLSANKLSTLINDKADGVAFDIEGPVFNQAVIESFILPLTQKIKGKPILIFDFPFNAWNLATNPLPSNLYAMSALYDYGMAPDSSNFPFQPLTVNQYKSQTSAVVRSYGVDRAKNMNFFFVLSGAATTELWHQYVLFNQDACQNCVLGHIKTGSATGVLENQSCNLSNDFLPTNLIPFFKIFLQGNSNFLAFQQDCKSYQNQNINSMSDYLAGAMDAFYSQEKSNEFSQNFKGFILYNHKDLGFYAINASKFGKGNYYGEKNKAKAGFYPETITVDVWVSFFNNWK